MADEYSFGNCAECGRWKALKNGVCQWCSEKPLPDFIKDFFENKSKDNKEE